MGEVEQFCLRAKRRTLVFKQPLALAYGLRRLPQRCMQLFDLFNRMPGGQRGIQFWTQILRSVRQQNNRLGDPPGDQPGQR